MQQHVHAADAQHGVVEVKAVEHPVVEVVWVNDALHREAVQLLETRLDKRYSLCDAVSFVLRRQRGLSEALTTDQHFQQEGFRRLLGS